ncbi:aldo/keto reductase [Azospirillum sp. YIM B02556]|uniref:Aldo/keto reductase n=1 Tax=Azospirillum endophyticum TaxID=2800326 RepID=A0ABS1FDH0_9PROT|nr:aldo/keto reductase [Azospirillum endophyticum]
MQRPWRPTVRRRISATISAASPMSPSGAPCCSIPSRSPDAVRPPPELRKGTDHGTQGYPARQAGLRRRSARRHGPRHPRGGGAGDNRGGLERRYAPATPVILDKVARIKAIADRHGIGMKAAGLRFALANPAVAAVIPGASRPDRIAEDRAALEERVPADFRQELRAAGLVHPEAPLPAK